MAKIVSYWTGSEAGMISGGARVEAAELGGGEYYSEKLPDVGGAPDTPGVPCFELNQKKKQRKENYYKFGHFFCCFIYHLQSLSHCWIAFHL